MIDERRVMRYALCVMRYALCVMRFRATSSAQDLSPQDVSHPTGERGRHQPYISKLTTANCLYQLPVSKSPLLPVSPSPSPSLTTDNSPLSAVRSPLPRLPVSPSPSPSLTTDNSQLSALRSPSPRLQVSPSKPPFGAFCEPRWSNSQPFIEIKKFLLLYLR